MTRKRAALKVGRGAQDGPVDSSFLSLVKKGGSEISSTVLFGNVKVGQTFLFPQVLTGKLKGSPLCKKIESGKEDDIEGVRRFNFLETDSNIKGWLYDATPVIIK